MVSRVVIVFFSFLFIWDKTLIFKWWLQNGETCLHAAATSGNPKLVKLLLEHGADPALCNDGGQTALDLLMMFVNYGNITLTPNLLKVCLPKVEVTFYLRLRNEFQTFLAKNQASDWLTQQVNQLETWFWREMIRIDFSISNQRWL